MVAVFADHLLAWLDASERFVHEGVTEPAGAGLGHQARPPLLEWQRRRLLPGGGHHQHRGQGRGKHEHPDLGARSWVRSMEVPYGSVRHGIARSVSPICHRPYVIPPKAERVMQTLRRECGSVRPYASSQTRRRRSARQRRGRGDHSDDRAPQRD